MPVGHYPYDAVVTFPNRGWQAVAYVCFVICLVLNSGILARRLGQYRRTFTTFQPLSSTWLCDVLALLVFVVSFLFIVINGILTFGIGTTMSETCDASVVVCVSVFVLAKVLLYLFYLERLYLLSWAKNPDHAGQPPIFMARFRTLPWVFGIGIFVFGVPCAIALGFSKDFSLIYNETTGMAHGCHVLLKWYLAFPTIVWAAVINTYVLIAFWLPIRRNRLAHTPSLNKLGKRTIWSAIVSGVATVINLSVLLILRGEHGIECLLCCSIDVMVNSVVLALVTDSRGEAASFPFLYGRMGKRDVHSPDSGKEEEEELSPSLVYKGKRSGNEASEAAMVSGKEV